MDSNALAYDVMIAFWRVVTNIFFREIRPRGSFNIPKDGPVIFVAGPHNNQFLDPLLVMSEAHRDTGRQISFLAAAKSVKDRSIGLFIRLMQSIPVARAADDAKEGTGYVYITEDDPLTLRGVDTKFTHELARKRQIMLSKTLNFVSAEVLEIISDTEARLKKEFGKEGGKGTSKILERLKESSAPGLSYKIVPYVDQQEMYMHVYEKLKSGGCVGIFPEGGSHDRTDFLPFKHGVAIMALGAMAANPGLHVQIVPVGLSYFHPERYRSRAVVEFGKPIPVPQALVEHFKKGGSAKRDATSKLLDVIYEALKTVTLRAPDYDTLMLIQAARRLYKVPGQHLSLSQVVELNKRFIAGYLHFQDEPRVQELRKKVQKYNRLLRDLGLKDHQVLHVNRSWRRSLGLLVYRVMLLTVWSVFALPGVVLNGPIFLAAKLYSRKKAAKALAASTVKLQGKDVMATWKVLISLGGAPILYSLYAFLATIVAIKAGAPLRWRIWTPFLVMIALPIIGYFALKFGEAGMDVLKSLRPLIVSLVPGQQKELNKAKKMREELQAEVSATIEEFGPKMHEDFDEWRLFPSASVPSSSDSQGITGGVDASGTLLAHPMTWLDERLFGWSKSSLRGTSAWGGAVASSVEASRVGSPDISDDEDHGDYDHVIGYLPNITNSPDGLTRQPKSLRGSFADLPSVRSRENLAPPKSQPGSPVVPMNPNLSPLVPSDGGGVLTHRRGSQRERKPSLSGNVPVERIGRIDHDETFKEATEALNQENEARRTGM